MNKIFQNLKKIKKNIDTYICMLFGIKETHNMLYSFQRINKYFGKVPTYLNGVLK